MLIWLQSYAKQCPGILERPPGKLYSKCTNFHPSDEAEKQRSLARKISKIADGQTPERERGISSIEGVAYTDLRQGI